MLRAGKSRLYLPVQFLTTSERVYAVAIATRRSTSQRSVHDHTQISRVEALQPMERMLFELAMENLRTYW